MEAPRFASGLSTHSETAEAEREALGAVLRGLAGRAPDLLALFVSHHHGAAFDELGGRLLEASGAGHLIGCTGDTVVGCGHEVEQGPALALWAVTAPGLEPRLCRIEARAGPRALPVFSGLPADASAERGPLLLFADPFSFPVREFLAGLEDSHPGLAVMGGMASGGSGPGQNLLFADAEVVDTGAVGVLLEGGLEVRTVVSQGCRPVGRPWVITECEGHMLKKLGGKPAARALIRTLGELDESHRKVFQRQPFIGLAVDANRETFERGDFLVRGILGMQQSDGALAVGDDSIRRGQTVQFLIRDAETAGEDLEHLLEREGCAAWRDRGGPSAVGALLFSCNGRGRHMFGTPDHDIRRVQSAFGGEVPAAGFFANGEIGPVGGRNFLHGFTASVALFRARAADGGPAA